MKKGHRKFAYYNTAFIFGLINLIPLFIFLGLQILKGPVMMEWLAMENNSDWVMLDHFRHIIYAQDLSNVYINGSNTCFPALAYIFYHIIYKMTCQGTIEGSMFDLPGQPWQMIVYIMYLIFAIILLSVALDEVTDRRLEKFMLMVGIVFSVPAGTGAIERGNLALYAVILMIFALIWKDSQSPVKRELSLVFIAVAAGLKIYPAVVGLIYLRERRFKEAIRLVIYGCVFFFVPFLFMDGFTSLQQFIDIIFGLMNGGNCYGRIQFFKGLIAFFGIDGQRANLLNSLFAVILLCGIIFEASEFRRWVYIAAIMSVVPGAAYRYTVIYFLLPLFVLLMEDKNEQSEFSYGRLFHMVALSLIFCIPVVGGLVTKFQLNHRRVHSPPLGAQQTLIKE